MPKLIVLNGPLGIGKSTLAKRYTNEHQPTLYLDIDELRKEIPDWRDKAEVSAKLSKTMAIDKTQAALHAGHNVIIPQIYRKIEYLEELEALAQACDSDYYEVLLYDTKENAIRRFIERGKRSGKPSGFNPDGLIGRNGGVTYLGNMYDEMMDVIKQRPNTIRLESIEGEEDSTYQNLLAALSL